MTLLYANNRGIQKIKSKDYRAAIRDLKKTRRNKYGAIKTTVDGIAFASKAEAKRYSELRTMWTKGEISSLVLQPEYILVVNGKVIGKYTPDFSYYNSGSYVVEDTKGFKARDFALRSKLFQALHPDIELRVNGVAAKRPKPPKVARTLKSERALAA